MSNEFNLSEYQLSARAHIEVLIANWNLRDNNPYMTQEIMDYYRPAIAPKSLIKVPKYLCSILDICFGHLHNAKRVCVYKIISLCEEIDEVPYLIKAGDFLRIWRDDFPVLAFHGGFRKIDFWSCLVIIFRCLNWMIKHSGRN